MRVHHVPNRLVRNELLRFRDVREPARLGLAGLEHHHVVLELDDDRIVAAGAGGEPPQAVAQLFGGDDQRRRRTAARAAAGTATAGRRSGRGRERRDIGGIRLRRRHVHFEERPFAARLHDLRRRHDAAEVLPARVRGDDVHVAHDVVAQPGLDLIDDVLFVHEAVDDVAPSGRRLHRGTPDQDRVAFDLAAAHGRVVLGGALQKPPRREVELQRTGPRLRDVRLLGRDLLEERSRRQCRRAAGADVVRRSRRARRRRREIDDADVVVDRAHRVVRALTVHRGGIGPALLEGHVLRRARIRDGFRIPQGLLRVRDYGFGVLSHRVPGEAREADCDCSQSFQHSYSSCYGWL